jgi:hypothetical protein
MAQARDGAAGCVLPSGRFAMLGGTSSSAEAFDPVSRAWQPLLPMPCELVAGVAVAVAGGLLALGGEGRNGAMLFDEESGRWFTLPVQMPMWLSSHGLTTIPAPRVLD